MVAELNDGGFYAFTFFTKATVLQLNIYSAIIYQENTVEIFIFSNTNKILDLK